ncbi:pseudouridine synthase [Wukongibacter baidiensis]|uniref:pseudouridine synthase n=1 Tax=Wukongibacter baidiensis TaxID=1723361 RepID=UPI003D7F34D4
MRLQKYIALAGVASRRKAEELISNGRVKVNGEVVTEMGIKVDPEADKVRVDDKEVHISLDKIYVLLNKPVGYVTTLSDEFNRPKVIDLLKEIKERVYPVGRLDYNTSGLLLLTNDGDLTHKITHPSSHIYKTYVCKIKGRITKKEMNLFRNGVDIGGYITAPAKIELLKQYQDNSLVKVIIHEGKNRQIRRMMEAIDHPVITLKRISIGNIELDDLHVGKWRYLTKKEVEYLKSL